MACRYDNPIPTRCLAPIDFLKIPARYNNPIPTRFLALIDSLKIPALETWGRDLVWKIEGKCDQITNDGIYLLFYWLFILW
jgi:hypothetical protein